MESSEKAEGVGQRAELEARVRAVLATQAAVDALREEKLSFGERAADRLAALAGSWTFIFAFLVVVGLWVAINTVAWVNHWDAYPFILLNLILSILAALQAPVIMMSQNRDQARDRLHSESDYRSSIKTEILMEHLTAEVEEIRQLLEQRGVLPG